MARYRGSVCRLCRREGVKLFLKGERCFTDKCAVERRKFAPGQHGQRRGSKTLGYGLQLREKQKVKRIYGLLENQFHNYFVRAERNKGITGDNLLIGLERRLDNIVYRLGFATSRNQARQIVRHGHVMVNKKKVNIPSYATRPGDEISIHEKSRKNPLIQYSVESVSGRGGVPQWLELNREGLTGKVLALPRRDELDPNIQEKLIVELYSK
ncbi:MAG: 30S ribosomal protein S4 [Acidobacteriia bacterium]|nr:30S ribosomal protein S4 [Terriglobia bacterium]